MSSPRTTRIDVISKPDCHLCDVAMGVIEAVIEDLPEETADAIEIVESSTADDPVLHDLWWEKIPVVLINGNLHTHWRVSPDRLRSALEEATR